MNKIKETTRQEIVRLRKRGSSIPEIAAQLGISKTTVQRYVIGISIPADAQRILSLKQGGSRDRANALREYAQEKASELLGNICKRDQLMLLAGIYWGEGTKRDFGIINSDPALIATFISALESLGVSRERISVSVRVHSDISVNSAITHWANVTGVSAEEIKRVEVVEGKKKGKLKYGMCRVRVRSGIKERLILQAIIKSIGNNYQNQ